LDELTSTDTILALWNGSDSGWGGAPDISKAGDAANLNSWNTFFSR
jgi:hypothetical protein